MKKILLATLFATVAGALVFGAAASLTVNSNDLGSGNDTIASCDTDGVDVSYVINANAAGNVDKIDVTGIDATACAGQTVHLSVNSATGVVLNASAPVDGSTAQFDVNLAAEFIEAVHVTITGPGAS